MKTISIGDTQYQLCETAEDLGIKRYNELKIFMLEKETGISVPSLIDNYKNKIRAYDNESKADMLIADYNFLIGLQNAEQREDVDQLIFSIIVMEENEDGTKFDKTKAKEKLERMASNGLTQKYVKETVDSFIEGSPTLSGLYFLKNLESLKTSLESLEKSGQQLQTSQ